MCRSSRILAFLLCLSGVTQVEAQGRGTFAPVRTMPVHAAPMPVPAMRPGFARAGIAARPARPFAQPAARARIFGTGQRLRGARRGGYGVAGLGGLGFDVAGLGLPGGFAPDGFGAPEPGIIPGIPAAAPPSPPCAEPLIIQIGRGLRHKARTRVVFGSPRVCGP